MRAFATAALFSFAFALFSRAEVPSFVKLPDIDPSIWNEQTLSTSGLVIDAASDETDPRFDILLLRDGEVTLPVIARRTPSNHTDLVDARIRVQGRLHRQHDGLRANLGPYLGIVSDSSIAVLAPPLNPFEVPHLARIRECSPQEVLHLGRRQISGVVLVRWNGDRFLLELDKLRGGPIRVELTRKDEFPPVGATVTVSGYPESDSFRVNLVRARCRIDETAPAKPAKNPLRVFSGDQLLRCFHGDFLDASLYGKPVCIEGVIRALPQTDGDQLLVLDFNGRLTPVDVSSCPTVLDKLALGCRLCVTGICYIDSKPWHPSHASAQAKGFSVLLRQADDLQLLARPPWWTPLRIKIVVSSLLLAIFGILLWNAVLRRLVERRGRELYRKQLETAKAMLKTEERTRLAVELHDALSQSLTGVAMEVFAAQKQATTENPHLTRAEKALKSCRDELRNCLWDLRSQALDERDMSKAVRNTLLPYFSDKTRIDVSLDIPRSRLSDNLAHTVLRSIRELVVNALTHGQATSVCVIGVLDGKEIRISVRDNGIGFDPATAPGIREGHFGLQGLRERLRDLGGTITFDTSSNSATSVNLCFPLEP